MELENRIRGRTERFTFARVGMHSFHVLHHLIQLSRGDWRQAMEALRQEVALQPDPHHRIHPQQIIGVWLARLNGVHAEAEVSEVLAAAKADAMEAGCKRCSRQLTLLSAEANTRIGRIEQAKQYLAAWMPEQDSDPQDGIWHRHILALVHFAEGDVISAVAALEGTLDERERLGYRHDLVWAYLDLAAGLRRDEPARAAEVWRKAGAQAEAMGAVTEARLADLGLRKLGVRTWRRGPAVRAQEAVLRLSERERQIGDMLVAGASNPDIARSLFLSRKTVERHVSNVLARTGARNRTELAGLLAEQSGGRRR
jgi:DNA-binding CsgD family transcriptional regulator